jgi:hypothetical protein
MHASYEHSTGFAVRSADDVKYLRLSLFPDMFSAVTGWPTWPEKFISVQQS